MEIGCSFRLVFYSRIEVLFFCFCGIVVVVGVIFVRVFFILV